jgi:tRNA pseudouridine38-40 synthase
VRVKAIICYDGTGYAGFQRQLNAPTIQADIEHAICQLTGNDVRISAAGRTDAGVHAAGQVIAFDTLWKHSLQALRSGINALLPEQIVVIEVKEVAETFHPRYDARRRHYRYTLYQDAVRNPLLNRFSLHCEHEPDVEAMQLAADYLLGRYDFSAFGSPPQGNNAIREVFRAQWSFHNPVLTFDIEANAFLNRMVRMIVGTLLRVGYNRITPQQFYAILQKADRDSAGPAAAAQGLCLMAVHYV